jgi:diguanylate cyclase (GGDEF)-like protein/PAS domain S-box-containing protein
VLRDRHRVRSAAVAVLGVAFPLWLWAGAGGETAIRVADNLAQLGAAWLAGLACLWTARSGDRQLRRAWALLGASAMSWGAGAAVWCWYELVVQRDAPFPSWSDVGYLGAVPLAVAAMLSFPGGLNLTASRARVVLDGLLISLSLVYVSWALILGPVFGASADSVLAKTLALAYPVGDLILVSIVVFVLSRAERRGRTPIVLLGGALMALAVADSSFAYFTQTGAYHTGFPTDVGWVLGYLLIALAALRPPGRDRAVTSGGVVTRSQLLLPYLPLALATLTSMVVELARGEIEPFLYWQSLVLTVLVVCRQLLVLLENRALVAREQVLRSAAATLVAAHDREGIYAAAVDAVCDLAGSGACPEVRVVLGGPGTAEVVAPAGSAAGARVELDGLADRLRTGHALTVQGPPGQALRDQAGLPGDDDDVIAVPLMDEARLQGVILVAGAGKTSQLLPQALETLGSQVTLALDRITLAEDLHMRRSEARFRSLVHNASDVILVLGTDMRISYAAPSLQRVFGYDPGEVTGRELTELLHPDDRARAAAYFDDASRAGSTAATTEWRLRHADESWRSVEATCGNLLQDPDVAGIVLTVRDVTDRKALESALAHQAFHDSVTELANRALFTDRLGHALARAESTGQPPTVLLVDLDDFKDVNDALGHEAGDELLTAVAGRLKACLGPGDTAARLGGDEFAVLVEGSEQDGRALDLAERCLASLRAPFTLSDREISMSASIGIAGDRVREAGDLLRRAEVAMYAAKAGGKGRAQVFEPSLHTEVLDRLHRRADLERAIAERQLVLYYQPIVELDTARMAGVEALVRWVHPERGLVPPMEFIPLAEETGLIIPLGRWVIEEACAQARRWRLDGGGALDIGINLSVQQFSDPGLVDDVARVVRDSGCEPGSIVFEITESLLIEDRERIAGKLEELKALGVRLAVDDFGTGYSSLGYLRQFPIDFLKVDKSFVDDVGGAGTAEDDALVRTILKLGESLKLQAVAEGIERPEQWHALRALGCRFGQGFYFARPMPATELGPLRALDHLPAGRPAPAVRGAEAPATGR